MGKHLPLDYKPDLDLFIPKSQELRDRQIAQVIGSLQHWKDEVDITFEGSNARIRIKSGEHVKFNMATDLSHLMADQYPSGPKCEGIKDEPDGFTIDLNTVRPVPRRLKPAIPTESSTAPSRRS